MKLATESLPADFVSRLRSDFASSPDVADRLLAATALELPRGLRVNPLRGDPDQTIRELDELGLAGIPVSWAAWSRVIPRSTSRAITETEAWRDGVCGGGEDARKNTSSSRSQTRRCC